MNSTKCDVYSYFYIHAGGRLETREANVMYNDDNNGFVYEGGGGGGEISIAFTK